MTYPRGMESPWNLGRAFVILGAVLVILGLALILAPRIPWLGRLPGDFSFGGARWRVYFPLATSLLLSLFLSLLLALFRRR